MLGKTKAQKKHSMYVIAGTIAVMVFFPSTYVMIKSKVDGLGVKS